jgi:hypothetical protein
MTNGIMRSDHMALRSLIDEKLNDPAPLVRQMGELAKIEFEDMLKEIESETIWANHYSGKVQKLVHELEEARKALIHAAATLVNIRHSGGPTDAFSALDYAETTREIESWLNAHPAVQP